MMYTGHTFIFACIRARTILVRLSASSSFIRSASNSLLYPSRRCFLYSCAYSLYRDLQNKKKYTSFNHLQKNYALMVIIKFNFVISSMKIFLIYQTLILHNYHFSPVFLNATPGEGSNLFMDNGTCSILPPLCCMTG